jgi:hypothetical protein
MLLGDDKGIGQGRDGRSRATDAIRTRSDLRGKVLQRKDRELVGEVGVPGILAGPHQSGGKLDTEEMKPG